MKLSGWGLMMPAVLAAAFMLQGCGYRFVRTDEIRARELEISELRDQNQSAAAHLRESLGRNERLQSELQSARDRINEVIAERDTRLGERDRYIEVQREMLASLQNALEELKREREREADTLREQLDGMGIVDSVTGVAGDSGALVRLKSDIMFDPGQAVIKDAAKNQLSAVAAQLKRVMDQNQAIEIRVAGFTDTDPIRVSPWDSNLQLSGARSLAVLKHLQEGGLPASRMHFAGYGEYRPIVVDGREDKARSRRVELLIITPTEGDAAEVIERVLEASGTAAPRTGTTPPRTQPPTK